MVSDMAESIYKTAKKISQLKIQGARNVAIAAIGALVELSKKTKAKTKQQFLNELSEGQVLLFSTRETEPLMRNAIRWIISQVEKSKKTKVNELTKIVESSADEFLSDLEKSKNKTIELIKKINKFTKQLNEIYISNQAGELKKVVKNRELSEYGIIKDEYVQAILKSGEEYKEIIIKII